jgi:hypothetical protein
MLQVRHPAGEQSLQLDVEQVGEGVEARRS